MGDAIYWTVRVLLVLGWLSLAVRLWRSERRGLAVAAATFASMRAWPWNYGLLEGARTVLRGLGAYDDRYFVKVALLALLVVAVVATVLVARRRRWGLLFWAMLVQSTLLAMETCSLDDWLPRWAVRQPGRYLLEGGALVGALWATSAAPARPR